ncbi:hypothetical protein CEJ42_01120 [Herbaspirillum robiniae]|uniref:Uncharacterized protein n=1 Tax=Herbaspirillum robiniae TaxID=2014887 RepID=A0A246WUG2_9BURK|nr:hypothetical protein CEJ42_01120 [Herbaspirillum robiniae]
MPELPPEEDDEDDEDDEAAAAASMPVTGAGGGQCRCGGSGGLMSYRDVPASALEVLMEVTEPMVM